MTKNLVDLLWRESATARTGGRRGPQARVSTSAVVDAAVAIADAGGTEAVTIRALAQELGITTMSVYTHVNSRADLLVLMADAVHARSAPDEPGASASSWRDRVRAVATTNLALLRAHPWLLDVTDPRLAVGPGTIAKYDRELHAFDGLDLADVDRDAALSFVLDFARAAGARANAEASAGEFGDFWTDAAPRLAAHLGDAFPLAQAVGAAAGESMGAPYDAGTAWAFGMERMLDGLAGLVERR